MTDGRLGPVARLARRIAAETAGGVLNEALERVLEATPADSVLGFSLEGALTLVAEKSRESVELSDEVREASRVLANQVFESRERDSVKPLAVDAPSREHDAILRAGFDGCLVVPLVHWRSRFGALVLLAQRGHALDAAATEMAETLANLVALALYRDHRLETEREQRAELEEAGRMASLGLLTASVAHELRGPVGALILQMEEQRRSLDNAKASGAASGTGLVQELLDLTGDMETAVTRIRGTIDQLSKLSRKDAEPEKLDLGQVVRESLTLARPYLRRRGISLVEDIQAGVSVKGRRDNLGQVVLNLVFNAADACEQSNQPTRRITVRVGEDTSKAVLQVDDNGPGIPESRIKTIFRPFYTTKARGKGTGLGLKICSDVVTAHGGHIEVFNRPEGGASFRVLLPCHAEQRPSARVPRRSDAPQRARRIMVVDDDPVFARTVRRGLKDYDVIIASAASEAEITLADPSYKPDLVLCDVFLPGVNGNVLHARLKKHDPELASRFVFVTGGALSRDEADYLKSSGCPTLFKPLNLDDVVEMLEEGEPESRRTLVTLTGGATDTPRRDKRGER
jgi:signal transduction histidine kinase/ActR/RegA family two-component response regulator